MQSQAELPKYTAEFIQQMRDKTQEEVACFVTYLRTKTNEQLHVLNVDRKVGNEAVYYAINGFKVTQIHMNPSSLETVKETFAAYPDISFKDPANESETFDVVSSVLCLPFLSKDIFPPFCQELFATIKPGGYFVGNFFGNEDGWANNNPQMKFLSAAEARAMFDPNTTDFAGFVNACEHQPGFKETKETAPMAQGGSKYWHIFSVIAQKKSAPAAAAAPIVESKLAAAP